MNAPMTDPSKTPHFDVLIVGAGISGIDAAYHLSTRRPGTTFAMLEGKSAIGGTWHTHRFPGIRSDSDLFTFGFSWKPWTGVPIATAEEILIYLNGAVDENDLRQHIRFDHQITSASWSTTAQRWTLTVGHDGQTSTFTCGFLWMCAGYFQHEAGYTPEWPGMGEFAGPIIHPQRWPDDLDYSGKRVAVIGSGATAATLIPAMARDAAHVTMVQRSPTYYYPRPVMDEFNETLSALDLPDEWYHEIMRRKFLRDSQVTAERSRTEPDALARDLIAGAQAYLGEDYEMSPNFTPTYPPWRQRVAMVPDGDLFVAIREGRASVITSGIEAFTADGLRLTDGQIVEADIIVTATGLVLNMFGDIAISVDGQAINAADLVTHRGIMFTGLPNMAMVFGYLRSSWTMRADLVSDYICRLLDHMDQHDLGQVVPALGPDEQDMDLHPWIAPANFNAGYIARSLDRLPKQGSHQPWLMTQDYYRDRVDLPDADLEDGTLQFSPSVSGDLAALKRGRA